MARPCRLSDISGNPIGDEGAAVLAASPRCIGLRHLGLRDAASGPTASLLWRGRRTWGTCAVEPQ